MERIYKWLRPKGEIAMTGNRGVLGQLSKAKDGMLYDRIKACKSTNEKLDVLTEVYNNTRQAGEHHKAIKYLKLFFNVYDDCYVIPAVNDFSLCSPSVKEKQSKIFDAVYYKKAEYTVQFYEPLKADFFLHNTNMEFMKLLFYQLVEVWCNLEDDELGLKVFSNIVKIGESANKELAKTLIDIWREASTAYPPTSSRIISSYEQLKVKINNEFNDLLLSLLPMMWTKRTLMEGDVFEEAKSFTGVFMLFKHIDTWEKETYIAAASALAQLNKLNPLVEELREKVEVLCRMYAFLRYQATVQLIGMNVLEVHMAKYQRFASTSDFDRVCEFLKDYKDWHRDIQFKLIYELMDDSGLPIPGSTVIWAL